MAVETLRPNAAGDLTECTPSAGDNYECVDEPEQDGDATYVAAEEETATDLYNLDNSGVGAGDITNVRVVVYAQYVNPE